MRSPTPKCINESRAARCTTDIRDTETLVARRSERDMRDKVEHFSDAMDQQRVSTLDITADMSRQYKSMQEKLVQRIEVGGGRSKL